MGAYQVFGPLGWALIRRWEVNRINAVCEVTPTVVTYYIVKTNGSTVAYNTVKVMFFCSFHLETGKKKVVCMKKVRQLVLPVAEYVDI